MEDGWMGNAEQSERQWVRGLVPLLQQALHFEDVFSAEVNITAFFFIGRYHLHVQ